MSAAKLRKNRESGQAAAAVAQAVTTGAFRLIIPSSVPRPCHPCALIRKLVSHGWQSRGADGAILGGSASIVREFHGDAVINAIMDTLARRRVIRSKPLNHSVSSCE